MGVSPLLLTKIEPPRIRPGHVPRRELVERLRHGLHRRLNLVSAPAGWGKTTLLAEWLTAEDEISFAWLSLDEEDNDPARFWTYVAAALRRAGVDVPAAFESAVAAPGIAIGDAALPLLLNALVASPREHVFVLDDYHVIHEPAIHEGVRFVLAHLPVVSHLVIATRADPPVDLSRLRARGELGEVLTEQLRFNDAEAASLLNDSLSLALPAADLDALQARTEGWAAGLYLAGLSLRDRPAPALPEDLGYDRHLVDYLGDEVLSAQTAEARARHSRGSPSTTASGRVSSHRATVALRPVCSHAFQDEAMRSAAAPAERAASRCVTAVETSPASAAHAQARACSSAMSPWDRDSCSSRRRTSRKTWW